MKVGVLALQGDVPEHRRAVEKLLGRERVRSVRHPRDLDDLNGLFLPGGESTTLGRLLDDSGLREPLREKVGEGVAVLATCAGLVLLAREIAPSPGGRDPRPMGLIDVRVRRNDYGRQRESFEVPLTVHGIPNGPYPGVFIRSPRIAEVGPRATPIAWNGKEVVGVRDRRLWGLTFHPELAGDPRVHAAFLAMARRAPTARPAA